ncbi:hypothetical protein M514_25704 [Trichuris suis]|uniref:Uncharacterized protein n=1 Tax=Trichuris suis TaxID=68888 RepID=A0A085MY06_9BILA|nr:hypothetical protein M514_25704 [Trichuris suis]
MRPLSADLGHSSSAGVAPTWPNARRKTDHDMENYRPAVQPAPLKRRQGITAQVWAQNGGHGKFKSPGDESVYGVAGKTLGNTDLD